MMFWYGNHCAFWPMGLRLDRDPGAESLAVSG